MLINDYSVGIFIPITVGAVEGVHKFGEEKATTNEFYDARPPMLQGGSKAS